jgi:hypothetical protein
MRLAKSDVQPANFVGRTRTALEQALAPLFFRTDFSEGEASLHGFTVSDASPSASESDFAKCSEQLGGFGMKLSISVPNLDT